MLIKISLCKDILMFHYEHVSESESEKLGDFLKNRPDFFTPKWCRIY